MKGTVRRGRLPTVQMLRGFAACMVVFYHTALFVPPGNSLIHARGLFWLGKCGVDLFFAISGFIMVYTTTDMAGTADATLFLSKRALRIYPLYWLWTSIYLVVWASGIVDRTYKTYRYSAVDIWCSYILIPHFNGLDFHPLLSPGWTLSFEMLFYLMFSLTIVLGLKSGRLFFLLALFLVLALLGGTLKPPSGVRYLLDNSILVEFFYGVAAAEILSRLPQITNCRAAEVLSALLIAGGSAAFYWVVRLPYGEPKRFLYYGIPAFFVLLGAGIRGTAAAPRILVRLGDASYSIYLVHFIFEFLFAPAMRHIASTSIAPDFVIAVFGMIMIGLSALTYPLVEKPLMGVSSFVFKLRWPSKTNCGGARAMEEPGGLAATESARRSANLPAAEFVACTEQHTVHEG